MALWAQYLLIYESDEGVQRATRAPKTPQSYREPYLPRGSGLAPQRAAERRKNEGWRVERREKCLEHAEDGDEGDSGGESARVCEQEKFI